MVKSRSTELGRCIPRRPSKRPSEKNNLEGRFWPLADSRFAWFWGDRTTALGESRHSILGHRQGRYTTSAIRSKAAVEL